MFVDVEGDDRSPSSLRSKKTKVLSAKDCAVHEGSRYGECDIVKKATKDSSIPRICHECLSNSTTSVSKRSLLAKRGSTFKFPIVVGGKQVQLTSRKSPTVQVHYDAHAPAQNQSEPAPGAFVFVS